MNIRFGTDGWRGIAGEQVTGDGVAAVADAIARYLLLTGNDGGGLVIGHDCRRDSREFAVAAAEAAAGRGVDVRLTSDYAPTPAVAFAVRNLSAGGAIMITASHNAAQYNGIKFIPSYAGPATSDITSQIESLLQTPGDGRPARRGRISTIDPKDAYLTHIRSLAGNGTAGGAHVIVDPMHGAARGYVDDILRHLGHRVHVINGGEDDTFGGQPPDPKAEHLGELSSLMTSEQATLGVALDGDGDRLAACDRSGQIHSANRILPLIYRYLLDRGRQAGGVARTVATTHVLDRIAASRGQSVVETPVGFKYVGPLIGRDNILIAGEESGGISIRGHVPEKDGILGSVLLARLVAEAAADLGVCWKDLERETGPCVSMRADLHIEEDGLKRIRDIIDRLTIEQAAELMSRQVASIKRIDGCKVEYVDGSWWLIRPSGTEPVVRVYAEGTSDGVVREIIDQVNGHLKQH